MFATVTDIQQASEPSRRASDRHRIHRIRNYYITHAAAQLHPQRGHGPATECCSVHTMYSYIRRARTLDVVCE